MKKRSSPIEYIPTMVAVTLAGGGGGGVYCSVNLCDPPDVFSIALYSRSDCNYTVQPGVSYTIPECIRGTVCTLSYTVRRCVHMYVA